MKFTISTAHLKAVASVIGSVTDTAKVTMDAEGMSIIAVDAAHVSMVGLRIPATSLRGWEPDTDQIGMNIATLTSIVRLMDADTVDVTVEGGFITFEFGHLTRRTAQLDPSVMATPKIPGLKMGTEIKGPAKNLADAIRSMGSVDSDAISIAVNGTGFGIGTYTLTDELKFEDADGPVFKVSGPPAVSLYPKEYIMDGFKAIPSSTTVTMSLDTDYPIRIDFTDGEMDGFFLIAPRVEAPE